jgi:hypothetical protein
LNSCICSIATFLWLSYPSSSTVRPTWWTGLLLVRDSLNFLLPDNSAPAYLSPSVSDFPPIVRSQAHDLQVCQMLFSIPSSENSHIRTSVNACLPRPLLQWGSRSASLSLMVSHLSLVKPPRGTSLIGGQRSAAIPPSLRTFATDEAYQVVLDCQCHSA